MIELVIIACLAASPSTCQEVRQPSENPTVIGCMIDAQRQAVAWLSDHPKWALSRSRCELNVPKREPA
jgi:hypothetical protein